LAEVELSNIRCFEKLNLIFSNETQIEFTHWNTILGDNAAGKTTLLRSIALGLCPESDAVALMRELPGEFVRSSATEGYIKLTLCPEGDLNTRYTITTKLTKSSEDSPERVRQETEPKNFPWSDIFICAYGSYRSAQAETSHETYRSIDAVRSLFDSKTSLQNPELALRRRNSSTRKFLGKKLLNILMLDSLDYELKYDKTGLLLVGPWGQQPIASLSDGYRSTVQWVLDFLSWAVYADRLTFMSDAEIGGILLIDEIEQHLHPRWQRHIVRRLKEQFPSTQIIATTHTPLIAAGMADMEDGLLIGLESNRGGQTIVQRIDQHKLVGMRADQVLTSEAFGLITSRSPGSEEKIDHYALLKSKHNRSAAEETELESLRLELQDGLSIGENKVARIAERIVDRAMEEAIDDVSPDLLDLEIKRQLHELFGSETSQ
jgi:energy-coupling factor transporter ATP-binding protein EcfA2